MSISCRLVLSSALLWGGLMPATLIVGATPAMAQSVQPERTVFGIRFLGEWLDDYGLRYVFTDQGLGRLRGEVTRATSGETVATIDWLPSQEGMGGNFFVPNANRYDTVNDRGVTGYVDHLGEAVLVVRAGRFPNGRGVPTALDRAMDGPLRRGTQGNVFSLRRPAEHQSGGDVASWSGRWRTTRGQLELRPEGANLFGSLKQGENLVATERLALLGDAGGVAVGAWEREGEWTSTVDRGDLTLRLSPDGRSFSGWYTDVTRTGNTRIPWTGERLDSPATSAAAGPQVQPAPQTPSRGEIDALVAKLKGAWRTPFGPLLFTEYEDMGFTNLETQFTDANTGRRHSLYLTGSGLSLVTFPGSKVDRLTLSVSADGASFDVRGPTDGPGGVWRAHRETTPSQPTPPNPPPSAPPTSTPPTPEPAQPSSPAVAGFKPLNRVDVRIDRVIVARGYPTHQVHAFVTVKNTSAVPQYFTSGFVKVVLADADGVSWERSQPYRASGEPAELYGSTPVIQPGGELRVRFVFMPEADAQLTSITLSEGDKQAEFPVSGL